MFVINEDMSIYVTRGDIVHVEVSAVNEGEAYKFKVGDIVRIKIFGKKDCETVLFQKDFPITTEGETAEIFLTGSETRIGGVINKYSDYWYEIELNPDTNPQTIIGYDDDGAKIFRLFPEGRNLDIEAPEIEPEDIPIVDVELDATSLRPVQNQAIFRGIEKTAQRVTDGLIYEISKVNTDVNARMDAIERTANENKSELKSQIENEVERLETLQKEDNNNLKNIPRVYVSDSPDINPKDILGGEWELYDKDFIPKQWNVLGEETNVIDHNGEKVDVGCTYSLSCYRSGKCLRIFTKMELKEDWNPYHSFFFGENILNLNFNRFGVASPIALPPDFPPEALGIYRFVQVGSNGKLHIVDITVSTDGHVSIEAEDANGEERFIAKRTPICFDLVIPVAPSQMLNEHCNKFYWVRTA